MNLSVASFSLQVPTDSCMPKQAKKPSRPTNRRQFKIWLILTLNQLGEKLPQSATYRDIQLAIMTRFPSVLASQQSKAMEEFQ